MATPKEGFELKVSTNVPAGDGTTLSAHYWRIVGYDADREKERIQIEIRGWPSFDGYTAGHDSIIQRVKTVDSANFQTYFGKSVLSKKGNNSVSQAYKFLKEKDPNFTEATILPKQE